MAWNNTLTNLRDRLADLYFMPIDSRRVVVQAGLNPAFIAFDPKAITNWFNILDEAQKQNKVGSIVDVALKEYPEDQILRLVDEHGELPAVKGPDMDQDLSWQGPKDPEEVVQLEALIEKQPTLLPISFLERGLFVARSVARVKRSDGGTGSGFLTHDNLLITNNHVLPDRETAAGAILQFNYQQSPEGLNMPVEEFALKPDLGFATSDKDKDDWTVVRVDGNANAQWGSLPLKHADPKKDDRVIIIQHPGGGPKQIALYHNLVAFVGENRLQYLTDTLPGSSGSPVFDNDWRVVALHHSSGYLREPGTQSKKVYLRNEGIHINAVIEGLKAEGLLTD